MVDSRFIPQFVSAGSPQGLRRAMLLANARAGAFHKFFGVQFVNGKWYAWYYAPVTDQDVEKMSAPDGGKSNG